MSDWLTLLREACEGSTQKAVGKRIGYCNAVISAVLKGTYTGNLKAVQTAVEGALMGAEVDCPVIGSLPRQKCIEHQRAAFSIASPQRVQLKRTCPTCPHNLSATRATGETP